MATVKKWIQKSDRKVLKIVDMVLAVAVSDLGFSLGLADSTGVFRGIGFEFSVVSAEPPHSLCPFRSHPSPAYFPHCGFRPKWTDNVVPFRCEYSLVPRAVTVQLLLL